LPLEDSHGKAGDMLFDATDRFRKLSIPIAAGAVDMIAFVSLLAFRILLQPLGRKGSCENGAVVYKSRTV